MHKFIKRVILIIGLIALISVFLINILYTGLLTRDETIIIKFNSFLQLLSSVLVAIAIYLVCSLLKNKEIKIRARQILIGIFIIIYVIAQVIFICNKQEIKPQADQEITYNMATSMKSGTLSNFINEGILFDGSATNKEYMERYKQQIPLAFVWQLLFRLFQTNSFILIEAFNIIGNVLTLISILLICNELSKKYNVNKYLATILTGTFVSLIYLVTFIYGDLLGLGFAMLGIYFIIKYVSDKKWYFALLAGISCSISYMLRMNYLIFILSILIYLFLDLIDKNSYQIQERAKKIKIIVNKLIVILCFIVVVFTPSSIIENYYCNKYNLIDNQKFQLTGYLDMGMSESPLAPGWYSYYIAEVTFKDYEEANIQYKNDIKSRLKYFLDNPIYTAKFYGKKLVSMWAENTYASTFYNKVYDTDEGLENFKETQIIRLYQKALTILIFGCTIVVIFQNRKNISNEVILLVTIFIGGFLFHILWEGKSRYVIPYIIVLIPIASIVMNKIKNIFRREK